MACAYKPRVVRGLGWTLVVLGCLSVTLGVAADITFAGYRVDTPFHFLSAPVWTGLLVLTTGILGILSAKKPTNKCLVIAFLVVGVLVIVTCVLCIAFAALGIVVNRCLPVCHHFDWDAYNATRARYVSYPNPYNDPQIWDYQTFDCTPTAISLHAVNISLALLEIILGFVVSILSCCEMRRPVAQTVIYSAGPVPGGADGNIVVMQGTPGAQKPGAAGAPVQVFYPGQQAPPPYQVDPGAHEEKKGPLPADIV
ncbi:PREDICTED: uncharacterized protein LOC109474327 [Branchiostoma belcheri]|uniref:Uncharacterized protein LOC109474327 n=1 Tax=Branchiostoma belcheri TaxID=7741 RepID=A0A6P4Z8F5_BRABE|nr:PREDICTED: uncharacterized protein LOC109474327 [Branchiostoma belcheri]